MSEFYRPSSPTNPRARRRGARSAAAVVAVVLTVGGTVAAVYALLRLHPRFTVTRVVLEGVPEIRRGEAEELTDPWIGRPLLFVDLDAAITTLSARPWVARAAARRIVPDTIVVQVSARPPIALARKGDELWTVDRSGAFLGVYRERATGDAELFAVIDPGPGGEVAIEAGGALARGAAFVDRIKSDDPSLYRRVSEVEVRPDGFAVVDRVARVQLLFGPDATEPSRAVLSWRAYLAVRPELERHALSSLEVDLRFADRIVLKAPAAEAGRGKT